MVRARFVSARRRPLLLAGPRPPERGAPLNYAAKHLRKGVQPGDTGAARLHQRTQQEREKQGVLQLPPAPHAGAAPAGQNEKNMAFCPVNESPRKVCIPHSWDSKMFVNYFL